MHEFEYGWSCSRSLGQFMCGVLLLYARIDTLKRNKQRKNKMKTIKWKKKKQPNYIASCRVSYRWIVHSIAVAHSTSWIIFTHIHAHAVTAPSYNLQCTEQMHFWNFAPNCNLNAAHYVIARCTKSNRTELQKILGDRIGLKWIRANVCSATENAYNERATCNWRWCFFSVFSGFEMRLRSHFE